MTRVGADPRLASIELWFRKAPVSFDEMIMSQDPEKFWIIRPQIPCAEYGDEPWLFARAFFGLRKRSWVVDNTTLLLGHSDLLVRPGSRRAGALLVNARTTSIPTRWYPSVIPLVSGLRMLTIGSFR